MCLHKAFSMITIWWRLHYVITQLDKVNYFCGIVIIIRRIISFQNSVSIFQKRVSWILIWKLAVNYSQFRRRDAWRRSSAITSLSLPHKWNVHQKETLQLRSRRELHIAWPYVSTGVEASSPIPHIIPNELPNNFPLKFHFTCRTYSVLYFRLKFQHISGFQCGITGV